MNNRSLSSVMDKIADAVSCYPELVDCVFDFLFDQEEMRDGLAISSVGVDGDDPTKLTLALWASDRLEQFANAVSQGFMPEMALKSAAVGD